MKKTAVTWYMMVLFLLFILISCGKNDQGRVITERIQYDVQIKSPDPEFDWWVQNLEGATRETFVKTLLDAAYQGKVKVYDPFHKLLTPEEVKAIGNRTDTLSAVSPDPPYHDTTIVEKQVLNIQDITKIRFLEEWTMDGKNLHLEKRVLGMAPMLAVYESKDSIRGYMPMFWVYFDEKYPGAFETNAGK